jgi:peptide/nickel transport system permease protein
LSPSRATPVWARLLRHPSGRWAIAFIALLLLSATIGPRLTKYSGDEQLDVVHLANLPPSREHPMGTDRFSRDVLARMLRGAAISLAVATLAVALSITLGTAYGLVAGYAGGGVDALMMRVLDGFLSIPRVMLVLLLLTVWRPVPLWGMILLLGATGWFGVSRLVRAVTLSAKHSTYVEAARALGASDARILIRHLLPNVIAPVIVAATLAVGNVIALEAGLSYLGVGAPEPTPSWGALFNQGASVAETHWWLAVFPGVAIVLTVVAFNVLGDALRDVLDPRQVHGSRETFVPAPLVPVAPVTQSSENG